MSKEQIEEIAKDLCQNDFCSTDCYARCRLPANSYCWDVEIIAEKLYNAGYRKQEWISVDERLPDNELERVLVFLKDEEFTKPIGDNKIDTDRFIDGKWVRWSRYVTHWMPLPEPPKMKGGVE